MNIIELLLYIIAINLYYVIITHYLLCYYLLVIIRFIIIIKMRMYINKHFNVILLYICIIICF